MEVGERSHGIIEDVRGSGHGIIEVLPKVSLEGLMKPQTDTQSPS
jgi:hypothetical protein